MTGTYIVHIPYRGTALVVPDMIGGQIHILFDNVASALPHLRDGKLRALAVTSPQRSPLLPDVPTVASTVPGFESIDLVRRVRSQGAAAGHRAEAEHRDQRVLTNPEFGNGLRRSATTPPEARRRTSPGWSPTTAPNGRG